MYYTIYETTNSINGKTYIGAHKTDNLEDGYVGSGKYLNRSINKYGIENFEKEILAVLGSSEDMFEVEALIVDEEFVQRKDTYNLKEGGFGGWDYINNNEELLIKRSLNIAKACKLRDYTEHLANLKKIHATPEFREKQLKGFYVYLAAREQAPMFGKKHTEETKQKMSESHKGKNVGRKNSQYGTCWITNEIENRKIKKTDEIPDNWRLGRTLTKQRD